MQLGMVGLGRMGLGMATRLSRGGHQVAVYNRSHEKAEGFVRTEGGLAAGSLPELVQILNPPRVVWLMLPAEVAGEHISALSGMLSPGDFVVEGGNSRFQDDLERAPMLGGKGIHYLDVGVSGGVWGLSQGYCLMVGGDGKSFEHIKPLLETLTPAGGYLHTGPVGSGHFVKMIHNAIEYGMMQAYAEGFQLMEAGPFSESLDFAAISRLWMQGSVVRSWLLELLARAFEQDPRLKKLAGYVDDSGEGRWAVEQAVNSEVNAPVIALSLMNRFRSRASDTLNDRVLAALRQAFGGHQAKKAGRG